MTTAPKPSAELIVKVLAKILGARYGVQIKATVRPAGAPKAS